MPNSQVSLLFRLESFPYQKERTAVSNLKLSDYGRDADQFLILHKFGHLEETHEDDIRKAVDAYRDSLHKNINPRW